MVSYDSLSNYYETMFSLIQFHNWSPQWVEGLVPWEKHIYVDMLTKYLRAESEKRRDAEAANRRK
jgi:hypothetical protein